MFVSTGFSIQQKKFRIKSENQRPSMDRCYFDTRNEKSTRVVAEEVAEEVASKEKS